MEGTIIKPNCNIGIIATQECASGAVQTSLSAFHQVGTSNADKMSLARIYSDYLRLNTTINDSITFVAVKKGESVEKIRSNLTQVYLKELVLSYKFIRPKFIDLYMQYHKEHIEKPETCVSMKINKDLLEHHDLTLFDIKTVIESKCCNIVCVPSPDINSTIEIMYRDVNKDINNIILGLYNETQISDSIIGNFLIKGIKNINPFEIAGDYIYCSGCNVIELANFPGIDVSRTYTNNVKESYQYYGAIHTKKAMIAYLKFLIRDSINIEAIEIVINNMMSQGRPIPVTYAGTEQQKRSPLFLMTFERIFNTINNVPYIEKVEIKSIYDKIAVGLTCKDTTEVIRRVEENNN